MIKGSVTLTLSGSRQVVSTDDEDNKKDDDENKNTTKNNVVTEDEGENDVQDNSKITPSPTPPPEKDPITPSDS